MDTSDDREVEKGVRETNALLDRIKKGVKQVDMMEVFFLGRLRDFASASGLAQGGAFHLRNGCVLSDESEQGKVVADAERLQATLRAGCAEVRDVVAASEPQQGYGEVPGSSSRRHCTLEVRDDDVQDPNRRQATVSTIGALDVGPQ